MLNRGEISKINKSLDFLDEIYESKKIDYLNNFSEYTSNYSLSQANSYFIVFYFSFLAELKSSIFNKSKVDPSLFSSYFYIVDFQQLFLTFFNYFNLNRKVSDKELIIKTSIIYKASKIVFKNWDKNMLLFLSNVLPDNLIALYNEKDDAKDKLESIYHIIGIYIFSNSNFSKLNDDEKLNEINKLFKKYEDLPSFARMSNSVDTILKKLNIVF
ncbi:hypothetical protein MLC52_05175 [Sulfurimonas sp. NW15]|uniref:hypothetical protein n=1 Tax=unclassified Sulfurimonas TaxID=2623549 RepID=UPI003DA7B33A